MKHSISGVITREEERYTYTAEIYTGDEANSKQDEIIEWDYTQPRNQ